MRRAKGDVLDYLTFFPSDSMAREYRVPSKYPSAVHNMYRYMYVHIYSHLFIDISYFFLLSSGTIVHRILLVITL